MKRIHRIQKNKDFKTVISKNNVKKSNEYIVYINKNNLNHTRIGISVSSKLGNAIIRNKIKRQIKTICNQILDLSKNLDIVIIAREEFKNKTYQENLNSLKAIIGNK